MLLAALLSCTDAAAREGLPELDFPLQARDPDAAFGRRFGFESYDVTVLAIDAAPGFRVGAALYEPEAPIGQAVIVAHGHFRGGGKSAPAAQELSHRLARRGVTVLAVDNPGMEAWGGPERALHGRRGAVNRGWLAAAGTSALSLQLAALRSGLDLLEARGFPEVAATGASGGAVLSFWLALEDPRVRRIVLAAVPDVPRGPEEGGCPCKLVPGWPGPDPRVLAALEVPSLWLSERTDKPPEGLPEHAVWRHLPGPHAYTEAMQREALAFLDLPVGELRPTPALDLRSAGPGEPREHVALKELPLRPSSYWDPTPALTPFEAERSCVGEGPTVVVAGGGEEDLAALTGAGFRACALVFDTSRYEAVLAHGGVFADMVAGAILRAMDDEEAVAAWGVGAWAVPVAAIRSCVLRDPLARVDELSPEEAWAQVPGIWWGLLPRLYEERCLATGDAPEDLLPPLRHAGVP